MSISALPRRLALDFRDVFNRGFVFDDITADFVVVDGNAYTDNLKLTGPVAEVGLIGRTGLRDRDYHQQAVVTAEPGKVLPTVGALLMASGKVSPEIDLIGFHGQTVFHDPSRRLTVQLGDGQVLADRFGIPTVLDFRAAAPLRDALLALRGKPIVVDGGDVERIGGQCIQVLVSAQRTWAQDGAPFVLAGASEEMRRALSHVGLAAFFTGAAA